MDFALVAKRLAGQSPAPDTDTDARSGEFDRRGFLKLSALGGGGLAVTWSAPAALAAEEGAPAAPKKPVDPSPFIKIHPDNTVEIRVNRLDFGQGALTALPMLVAEEMDADPARVRFTQAPVDPVFANTAMLADGVPFRPDDDSWL
ncbi:MAG: twin-arginine translocation signal domain-containing protein, partial [Methylibium sp.]|nr:twin-arginine translocation signal domain-containing protein [Methylibium sp.]